MKKKTYIGIASLFAFLIVYFGAFHGFYNKSHYAGDWKGRPVQYRFVEEQKFLFWTLWRKDWKEPSGEQPRPEFVVGTIVEFTSWRGFGLVWKTTNVLK